MRHHRWILGMLIIAHLAVLGGCWPFGRSDDEPGPATRGGEPPELVVTNMHWAAVNVYAVHGSLNVRLGTLTTNQRERYELPRSFDSGSAVHFVVDPIGSTVGYVTEQVYAASGQVIMLRIENNLNLSSVSVR